MLEAKQKAQRRLDPDAERLPGAARAPRHAEPPPSRPNSAEIADVERRFATAFSTVPPHRREHLIAHALLRLGTAYRTKAMVHLLDEKARCR